MGVKIQDLLNETAHAELQVGGTSVGLEYRVLWESHFTDADWKNIETLKGRAYYLDVLPRLLQSWDLLDAKGQPIPVTAKAIDQHQLPTRFLRMVERALIEARDSPKGSASSSPDSSPPQVA